MKYFSLKLGHFFFKSTWSPYFQAFFKIRLTGECGVRVKTVFLPREEKDSSLKIGKNSANNWLPARLGISKAKIKKFCNCRFQKNCTFLEFNPSLLDNAPTIPSALSKRDSPLWNR